VAQLGARLDGIEEAVGSNPIGSTKNREFHQALMAVSVYILQSESTGRFYSPCRGCLIRRLDSRLDNSRYNDYILVA
jgi:hypothetical protein